MCEEAAVVQAVQDRDASEAFESLDLLRELLDTEREQAQQQARWLSVAWVAATLIFLLFTLLFVITDANPRFLARQAEEFGAPALIAERLELAALAPVMANLSGAIFLNFWRVRRRKLRLILAEAMVIDRQFGLARGVLFGSDSKKGRTWRRMKAWARGVREGRDLERAAEKGSGDD
ncbi:MAG: hypothetical protein CME88_12550 [Hirschia sp.]|nr:hypothetical protein [Hirschia sp.]MBF19197.1 hypothetical protein [Hirschia sp.]